MNGVWRRSKLTGLAENGKGKRDEEGRGGRGDHTGMGDTQR